MKIIDTHAHIYPDSIADKAVKSIGDFYNLPIQSHGRIAELLASAKQYDVEKIVVCSVATTPKQVEHINDFLAGQKIHSEFLPLGALHPDMEVSHIKDELARIKELGLYGIKLHPDFQRFKLCGEKGRRLFDAIGDFDLPILVHTGDKRLDFSHPEYMIEIARDYPKLTFIAAHMGGWSEWEQALKYKGLKNVMFDTSSSLAFLDKTVAKAVILGLGVDKFLFGTDFPMWEYKSEIERFYDLELGEENNKKILRENARKLFNL